MGSEGTEPVVPNVEGVIEFRVVNGVFQKLVSLLHGPVELGQGLGIAGFQLAESLV